MLCNHYKKSWQKEGIGSIFVETGYFKPVITKMNSSNAKAFCKKRKKERKKNLILAEKNIFLATEEKTQVAKEDF